MCWRDNTRCDHEFILDEVFDHEFHLCDPNEENFDTNFIRCLYGKLDIEHLLNYSEQFSLQVVKYVDNFISSFLINLFNDNLLRNTTVFLVSDHGATLPSLYYVYSFYRIEGKLPMLYILVSDKKNVSYEQQYKYIYENQQNFITAFDFYNTLSNIIFGDKYKYIKPKTPENDTCKSPYGESLFNKINNNKVRHPKKFNKISNMSLNVCN